MTTPAQDLDFALEAWRKLGWPAPAAMVVTGSGLGVDLGAPIAAPVPLGQFLPFESHAVVGHAHRVELLEPRPGRRVLYVRGRLHFYQGYDPHQTVLPIRLAAALGAKVLILTNAAGGLDPQDTPGTLRLLADQLNLTGQNPLRGELPAAWGPRFPDMTGAYDPALRALFQQAASAQGFELREGIYAGLAGPSYETPAEIRMLGRLGADLVGMSTVLEVIAARHMGLRCAGLSLVTNLAAGVVEGALSHDEVLEAGQAAAGKVQQLLAAVLTADGLV
jgi:purine-nucleoside phosphorylase